MAEIDAVDQSNRKISRSTTTKRRYLRALERIVFAVHDDEAESAFAAAVGAG